MGKGRAGRSPRGSEVPMSQPLTTREIMTAVHGVTPHIESLTEKYRAASVAHLSAQVAYEQKEAEAFLEAIEAGLPQEAAKRKALLASRSEREEMLRLKEEKAAARLGSDAWQHVLDVYSALSHTLNRELKTFATGSNGYGP